MHLLTPQIQRFIEDHAAHDAADLALQAKRHPELPMAFIAQQIKGRRKAATKLPAWSEQDGIYYPATISMEQCSSQQAAELKATLVEPGGRAADLSGGFGVDATFLAQRFDAFHYVERNAELATCAERNFETFRLGKRVETHNADGIEWLKEQRDPFDLLYLDPARRDARSLKVSALEECQPNAVAIWKELLDRSKTVMLKASPGLDIDQALRQLASVRAVHVIAIDGECRELLFIAETSHAEEAKIICHEISRTGQDAPFEFKRSEEQSLDTRCSEPLRYLFDPSVALMKAGAFKTLSHRFNMPMLHPRTRLYTSSQSVADFPGRAFEIEGVCAMRKREAKKLFPEGKANVIAKNCGLGSEALKAKLGLSDGGEVFAIGASIENGDRRVFRCRRLP